MKYDRRRVLLFAFVGALPIGSRGASAQDYPTRPIRLVIPYPPGGVVEAVGRPWAEKVRTLLGTIVVENIPGGGGEVGAAAVSRALPDGYTVLLGNTSNMVISPLTSSHVPYDPVGSFDAVSILGQVTQAFTVHPSLPVRTMTELADYAKRNPGKLSYGTPGVGSLNQLTGELLKIVIKAPDIVHVPYRGAGPAIVDLMGGQIPMAVTAVNGHLLELHRAGKLRILAVTSPQPLRGAPDLPTVAETGMPELVAQSLTWLLVPKGTATAVIKRISQATAKALAEPELQQIYQAAGVEPSADASPETATQRLKSEIAKWQPIVKQIGLKLD